MIESILPDNLLCFSEQDSPQVLCALLPSRGLAAFITDIPGELSQCFSVSLVLRGCWACREEGAGPLVVAAGAWWVADNQRRVPPHSLFGLGKGGRCQPWPVSWLLPVQLLLSRSICPPCLVAAREGLFLPSVPLPRYTLPLPPQFVSLAGFSVLFPFAKL